MVRIGKLIVFWTTPNELRLIADNLERQWSKAKIGGEIPKHIEYAPDYSELQFKIDQEKIYSEPSNVYD